MPKFKLPTDEEVKGILDMIAQNCSVTSGDTGDYKFAAEFVDDDGALAGVCLSDFTASAAMGSALSMIPPGAVEDMCAEGELTEMAEANLYEIMNMFSTLFMSDRTPHLKLTVVKPVDDAPFLAASEAFEATSHTVAMGPYGTGHVAFRTV